MTLPVARSHCVAWIAGGLLAAGATPAMAEAVEGHAVSRDGEVATAFQWRVENCDGRMRSEWRTASGQMIAWDEVEFEAGHFLRYRLVRPNLGQDLTLHSSDKRTLGGPMLIEFDAAERFVGMQGQILPQRGPRNRPEPIAAQVRVLFQGLTSACHI